MLLLKLEKLKEVLRSFYTLTGVRIAVLDEWYNEITAFPEQICALCRRMRADEKTDALCKRSDREAFLRAEKLNQKSGKISQSCCIQNRDGQLCDFCVIIYQEHPAGGVRVTQCIARAPGQSGRSAA